MHSSGDPGMPLFWYPPQQSIVSDSMSVIITTFTAEGVVIAADGRETDAQNRSVISDSRQKIFPIQSPNGSFAYSICGTINLASHDKSEIVLNVADEAKKSAEALANRNTSSLFGYATRFCRPIQQSLKGAFDSGRIRRYPSHDQNVNGEDGETITRIAIDGYRDQKPSRVSIRFFHHEGQLQKPEIVIPELRLGSHRIYGSQAIVDLLWGSSDSRFSRYRGPSIRSEHMTLQDSIARSASYIGACSDSEALGVDEHCHAIGGHIHMAVITPAEGFRWVPGFEPRIE
jgi:hypothetical protein